MLCVGWDQDADQLRELLTSGIDVELKSEEGMTALMWAAMASIATFNDSLEVTACC